MNHVLNCHYVKVYKGFGTLGSTICLVPAQPQAYLQEP